MKNLNSFIPFLAVAREKSFRKAAARLGVTPGAISQAIATLEAHSGVRLFQRTSRGSRLTETGARLFGAVSGPLDDLNRALTMLDDLKGAPRGSVRLAVSAALGRQRVLPLMNAFLDAYPEISVEVLLLPGAPDFAADRIDVALGHRAYVDPDLVTRPLYAMKPALIASPGYLAQVGTPRSLRDLERHAMVVARGVDGELIGWRLTEFEGSTTTTLELPRHLVVAGQTDAVIDAATAGLGIAVVFADYVQAALADGRLVPVLPSLAVTALDRTAAAIVLQYPARPYLPMSVRVLVDFLAARLPLETGS